MTNDTGTAVDCAVLRCGDRIDVHRSGRVSCTGLVEDTMPLQGIVWIRELRTGGRGMLFTDECRIVLYEAGSS